jgi:hypothetical protein
MWKTTIVGELTIYDHPEGGCSVADSGGWVSALFKDRDAALSWRGHMTEAEAAWINRHKDKPPPWDDYLGNREPQ